MQKKIRLSTIIITKDAEDTIERCLASVSFADEVIVIVDSATTDKTAQIAENMGARVFTEPWHGYGKQKNIGLEKAQGKWVLFIDDDEELTPALAEEIGEVVKSPIYKFYWIRIVTIFLGEKLTRMYGHNPRLFKKSAGKWTDANVHEQVKRLDTGEIIKLGGKKTGKLNNRLLHYSHPTIKSYLKKMHNYTTLDAKEMARTNTHRSGRPVKPSLLLPYKLAIRQFLKLLIYRKGFKNGKAGFIWSTLSAYYEFEMARKYKKLV